MPDPERILIIRPSALGDVCRTVPVLVSLRKAYPRARIDWLVQDTFAPAVEHHPALSSVIPFPREALKRWWTPRIAREALRWLKSLRDQRYDLVLDCQGLFRSGLFAWSTRAPKRVGHRNARELGWAGVNIRINTPSDLHTVDRMLKLLEPLEIDQVRDMRLYSCASERDWVHNHPRLGWAGAGRALRADDVTPNAMEQSHAARYAVIAPTSRWPGKRWPAERFALVASHLLAKPYRFDCIAVVGSESEREQCEPILELATRGGRIIDLVGKTSIARLMALVESASLVIANDSAALHMAVGFARPFVGIYGPTQLHLVGPYTRPGQAVQRLEPGDRFDHKNEALGRRMMSRVSVEDVMRKIPADLSGRRISLGA